MSQAVLGCAQGIIDGSISGLRIGWTVWIFLDYEVLSVRAM